MLILLQKTFTVAVLRFDIADDMGRLRHRREHQRPRLEQARNPDREDGVILIDNGSDVQRVGLAGLARHPIDALRLVQFEPGFEISGIE
jgi:hypothetical protein